MMLEPLINVTWARSGTTDVTKLLEALGCKGKAVEKVVISLEHSKFFTITVTEHVSVEQFAKLQAELEKLPVTDIHQLSRKV